MAVRKIAIVGAGPIGLEAALLARRDGFEVRVFETGRIAEHFARYGPVRLFTPFRMNSTELGRERLRSTGVKLPGDEEILTAAELRARYLLPLSRLPEMSGVIREGTRVGAIAREGLAKGRFEARGSRPFLLRIEDPNGEPLGLERADVVIDASGVYAGKRILLVGDGRSAANVIADLDELVRAGGESARTRIEWVHRDRGENSFAPVPAAELTELPVLRELNERASRIALGSAWIRHHAGATVVAYRPLPSGTIEVALVDSRAVEERIEVDRVLALVGYRPDLSLFRELQIHICYASEGPMALAAAVLAAQSKDPEAAQGCLGQVSHGPETLKNPEPDFYILGAKSYGRNPNFLLTLGHQQIEDVMGLIAASQRPVSPASR